MNTSLLHTLSPEILDNFELLAGRERDRHQEARRLLSENPGIEQIRGVLVLIVDFDIRNLAWQILSTLDAPSDQVASVIEICPLLNLKPATWKRVSGKSSRRSELLFLIENDPSNDLRIAAWTRLTQAIPSQSDLRKILSQPLQEIGTIQKVPT